MIRQIQTTLLVVATLFLLLAAPLHAARLTGPLVDVEWLKANLDRPDLLILDLSAPQTYASQHIAGAINMDMILYGAADRSNAEMEQLLQAYGVSPEKKVVLVDEGGTYGATRLFYSLYYYGFPLENLAVLDGGTARWQAAGLPLTKDVPAPPKKGTFRIGKIREEVRVRLPQVVEASGAPARTALVEALAPAWHYGETVMFGRGGHIPNGILFPTGDLFNADKTFKSPAELKKMAEFVGIRPDQEVYTYCGGGVAASAPWFALKFLAGYPAVKLFIESELGWLKDERQLPYWTYDAPYLLRDANWVQSWGGQMLRMFSLADVSIVDVRPPAAYAEGHVPFALNVPVDVFRSHLATPERLGQFLGAAGIHPSHEAVVISGAGITPEAALAFAMLEKAGQKKVSLLTDPEDRWAAAGVKLTKDAPAVGPKKGPRDLTIAPAEWTAKPRPHVLVADPTATAGPYPKVFIASGRQLPTRAPEGKVVHVPYIDLLNADGTPKSAVDIWKVLSKAGVPRYAELVCVADDPGEAAVTYFVLRLMGYPDVKVLAS